MLTTLLHTIFRISKNAGVSLC